MQARLQQRSLHMHTHPQQRSMHMCPQQRSVDMQTHPQPQPVLQCYRNIIIYGPFYGVRLQGVLVTQYYM